MTVTGLQPTTSRQALAYNLSIDQIHTYHVGQSQTLVHNTCTLPRNALGQFTAGAGGESAAAAAGRTAHDSYELALGAHGNYELNKQMPGSLMRPDAIDHTNRVIRELKPDNPAAIARGWRQVNRYKEYMESITDKEWTVYVDVYKP